MLTGAPGEPLVLVIWAPAIFPTSAWSIEAVEAAGKSLAETDSTATPSFALEVATPTPVTTTSLS